MNTDTYRNGCHDRKPFKESVPVQDGHFMDGVTRTPRMVSSPFRMARDCQYTKTTLGQADKGAAPAASGRQCHDPPDLRKLWPPHHQDRRNPGPRAPRPGVCASHEPCCYKKQSYQRTSHKGQAQIP